MNDQTQSELQKYNNGPGIVGTDRNTSCTPTDLQSALKTYQLAKYCYQRSVEYYRKARQEKAFELANEWNELITHYLLRCAKAKKVLRNRAQQVKQQLYGE